MATDMEIYGVDVKRQSALGLLGLALVTLGIYVLFWVYRVNREMRDFGRRYGDAELGSVNPWLSLLGSLIPIVNFFVIHRMGRRIQRVQDLTGRGADYSLVLHWVLVLVTGLWWMYAQHALSSLYSWIDQSSGGLTAPQAPAEALVAGAPSQGGPFVG